jgi:peptide/nickel transport system permease protein
MRYYVRRVGQAIITLIAATFITFALYRLMPGGPLEAITQRLVQQMQRDGGQINTQLIAQRVENMTGINPDQPVPIAFFNYVRDIVLYQDFGESIVFQEPVFEVLFRAMPWSIFISIYGLLLGFTAMIFVGSMMAWKEGTRIDSGLTVFVLVMNSIPYYVGAIVMLVVLGYQWGIFPTGGRYPANVSPGFTLPFMIGIVRHATLPIMSSFIIGFAGGSLGMRGNSVRIMGSDYLRSAEIRGLSTNRILTRYLTRNAILPIYTGLMIGIAGLFSSSVITETIFQYPGVGYYMLEAIELQDYPLVMGGFLFFSVLTIVGILIADFTYGLIDPRAGSGADRESF